MATSDGDYLEEGGDAAEEGANDDDSEEHGDNGRDEVEGVLILLGVDKPVSEGLRSAASIRKRLKQDGVMLVYMA